MPDQGFTTPEGWGQPPTGSAPRPPTPIGAKIAIGVLGGFVLIGGCNAIIKKTDAGKTAPVAAATSSAAPIPSPTPKPVTPTPAAPSAAPALASPAAPTLAPVETRKKAAEILRANDAYYKTEFDQGVAVITARGSDNSFPAFSAWYQKAHADVQPSMDAFKQADAVFTADNEPQSISDWRDDSVPMTGDLFTLASDGLDVGGPDDANARQKVQADIAQMRTDLATSEQDAANVEAGK